LVRVSTYQAMVSLLDCVTNKETRVGACFILYLVNVLQMKRFVG
jgi:hypothetical protein